jgi:phage baseplate assembly protein W
MAIPNQTSVYGKIIPPSSKNTVTLKVAKEIGFKYPFQSSPKKGYFSKSSGLELIKSNLIQLIKTSKGERFMLPEYGCNLRNYLMEPLDETTFNEVKIQIQESVARYLKQVSILKLQVFETDTSLMNVKLVCGIRNEDLVNFEVGINV